MYVNETSGLLSGGKICIKLLFMQKARRTTSTAFLVLWEQRCLPARRVTLARGAIFLAGVEDVGQSQAGLVSRAGTDKEERLGVNPCQEAATERKALVYKGAAPAWLALTAGYTDLVSGWLEVSRRLGSWWSGRQEGSRAPQVTGFPPGFSAVRSIYFLNVTTLAVKYYQIKFL